VEDDPCVDFLTEQPVFEADSCAPGAAVAESVSPNESVREQSRPDPEDGNEPSSKPRLVPTRRIITSRSMSYRHWPRRTIRNREAVDNLRRVYSGCPGSGPRDASSSVSRVRVALHRVSGRVQRIRRGYRPRSPPDRSNYRLANSIGVG
jgi:hypothetical protein